MKLLLFSLFSTLLWADDIKVFSHEWNYLQKGEGKTCQELAKKIGERLHTLANVDIVRAFGEESKKNQCRVNVSYAAFQKLKRFSTIQNLMYDHPDMAEDYGLKNLWGLKTLTECQKDLPHFVEVFSRKAEEEVLFADCIPGRSTQIFESDYYFVPRVEILGEKTFKVEAFMVPFSGRNHTDLLAKTQASIARQGAEVFFQSKNTAGTSYINYFSEQPIKISFLSLKDLIYMYEMISFPTLTACENAQPEVEAILQKLPAAPVAYGCRAVKNGKKETAILVSIFETEKKLDWFNLDPNDYSSYDECTNDAPRVVEVINKKATKKILGAFCTLYGDQAKLWLLNGLKE